MSSLPYDSRRLDTARHYRALGWWCVPIAQRKKAPDLRGWPGLRLEGLELSAHFAGPGNVGVLLSAVSGGLADIDLDCPEAVDLAPRFLPSTWTFGRASKPRSHWIYVVPGGVPSRRFLDRARPDGKRETLLEVRCGREGERHLQTVFPPSIHPSGEPVEWTDDADGTEAPRQADGPFLFAQAEALRMAVHLKRHTPQLLEPWLSGGECPAELEELADQAPGPGAPSPEVRGKEEKRQLLESDVDRAVARWNREHSRVLPRGGTGACPTCSHKGCFGAVAGQPGRWACFSAAHGQVGKEGGDHWWGDFLDLDAHAAGVERLQLLRQEGYLR